MRWLRLALTGVQFFAFTVVFAQGQSPLPVQPLKGHVETADDHKPLAGVKMTLGKLSIVTDQQGDFSFAEVSPGAFIVRAELNGYLLRVHRGIVVAGLTPDPFTMRLPRAASIEGVVEDPDGHPLADAAVGLLSQRFAGTVTSDAVPVRTDAQGRFLIQNLEPGTYFVRASATTPSIDDKRPVQPHQRVDHPIPAFRDVYYPNSADFPGAVPIVLASGGSMPDIRLRLLPPESYRVSGNVNGTSDTAGLTVTLWEIASLGSTVLIDFNMLVNKDPVGRVDSEGKFSIEGVPPGAYSMVLRRNNVSFGVKMSIAVVNRDVENVVLYTTSGTTVTGRVIDPAEHFKGGRKMELRLSGAVAEGTISLHTQVTDRGEFTFTDVRPARYRIGIYLEQDLAVNRVDIGGRSIEGATFDLYAPGAERLVVTLGKGGTVSGTIISTSGKPAEGLVSAIRTPLDSVLGSEARYSAGVRSDGTFAIKAMEPGEYRICAWREAKADLRAIVATPQYPQLAASSCSIAKIAPDGSAVVSVRQISTSDLL